MIQKIKICIVDYGVGNTQSVTNALAFLGYTKIKITDKERDIVGSDVLILPGVGAFDEAVRNLKLRHLDTILSEDVIAKRKPILGICVGMQMLATVSEENGIHDGLNWIEGRVKKLEVTKEFPVPHVGWNDIQANISVPLFSKFEEPTNFYFDHSYHFECDSKFVSAWCDYGTRVTAAVQKENIFGVQFHPEKSQTSGLKMFRSFLNSV